MIDHTIKTLAGVNTKTSKLFIIILDDNENSVKACIVLLRKSLPLKARMSIDMNQKNFLMLSSIICKCINDSFKHFNDEKLIKLNDYIIDFCKNNDLELQSIRKFFEDYDTLFGTNMVSIIMSFKK